ncbi:glycine cleavage T C-terminal barrel domain-containing protein [Mesorhizobium robiniae]|uniref:glycine cleavage T C-terminal barrel domain-containing protein n=1 Tax=Mesorhizobium TaxID=68287 RepID=UPI00339401A0
MAHPRASGDEPILHDGNCVGYVTSRGFGHRVSESLAMGYVPVELAKQGLEVTVEVLGHFRKAVVAAVPVGLPIGSVQWEHCAPWTALTPGTY